MKADMSSMDSESRIEEAGYPSRIQPLAVQQRLETVQEGEILLAAKAETDELQMTLRQALKKHKKAAFWSALLSTALVMEGYDLVIINSFFGQAQFLKAYGTLESDGTYHLSSAWQTGLSNSALCGEIVGLGVGGYITDWLGYRRTYMLGMAIMVCCIFASFFAESLPILSLGEVLCGIPWGIFQTLTTAYASEICPVALRPYLTTYVNMCWGMGIFISSGVGRAAIEIPGKMAYKLPFALQWIWPVPLFIAALFAPESPSWLVRKGKDAEAKEALRRLTQDEQYTEIGADGQIALLKHTDAIERAQTEGTTFFDCFRGTNRRRTEIACAAWAIQWLCGNPLISYSVVFLQKAGLNEQKSFDFNLSMNTMYIVGTITSWFLVSRFGRRSLYLFGISMMGFTCLIIGCLGIHVTKQTSLAIGVLMIVLNLSYNISIGPICYCIVAEMGSSRLRAKTVVLARLSYNLTGLVTNTIQPRMIDSLQWNWGAKSGFFWLGSCCIIFTYCWIRLPETRGRSYGELDTLFENRIPARKFASTSIDLFGLAGSTVEAVPETSDNEEKIDTLKKHEASGPKIQFS